MTHGFVCRKIPPFSAQFGVVALEAGGRELQTVRGREVFVRRGERGARPFTFGEAGDHVPALRVDVDLAVRIAVRTERPAFVVEVADIPGPVPGLTLDGRLDLGEASLIVGL